MSRKAIRVAVVLVLVAVAVGCYEMLGPPLPHGVPGAEGDERPGNGTAKTGDTGPENEVADPTDPWLRQPVLHRLLLSPTGEVQDSAKRLAALLHLTAEEWGHLVEVARYEREALIKVERYRQERTATLAVDNAAAQDVLLQVKRDEQRVLKHVDRLVRKLLGGERYAQFREWVRTTWIPTRGPAEGLSNG